MKTKKTFQLLFCLISLLSLSGCFIGRLFQDTTVKRYRTVKYQNYKDSLNTVPFVDISVFSSRIENKKTSDNSKSLWDLDGEGEAKLLEILHKRNDSNEAFITTLEKKYLKPKNNLITDFSTQNLRLVLSISKNRNYGGLKSTFSLADRIEYLKIKIKNNDANIHFTKWNKFETEYGTLNIGDVTFNESVTLSGGLNASRTTTKANSTASATDSSSFGTTAVVTPSATISGTNGIQEVQKLGYRFLALNGKIASDSLVLEQEGIRDIDLAGNIILDVEIKFDVLSTETFFQFEGFENLKKGNQKISRLEVKLPEYRNLTKSYLAQEEEIRLPIEYNYVYRHVTNSKGAKTFYEWDDDVVYYEGKKEKIDNLIMRQKDYMPQIYYVGMENETENTIGLFFRNKLDGEFDNIQSLNLEELRSFIGFLQQKSLEIKEDGQAKAIEFGNFELVYKEEKDWNSSKPFIPMTWKEMQVKRNKIYLQYAFDFENITRNFVPAF